MSAPAVSTGAITDLSVTPLQADGAPCQHIGTPVYSERSVSVSYDPDTSGGQWRRYALALAGLVVTQWQGALPDVLLVRNAELMGLATADGFQHRTAPARFPRAVNPMLANTGSVLDVTEVVGQDSATLVEFVSAILQKIFEAAPEGAVYPCVIGCSFGYPMVQAAEVLSPMRLAPQVPLAPAGDPGAGAVEIEAFAATFATACLDWLAGKTWPADAFLSFRLAVLGSGHTVVLELPALRLPLSAVTDA